MASSGVCVSAQMPPATPNTVKMRIRNALRALASMMRSTSVGVLECWSVGVWVALIIPSLLRSITPVLQRALHFGFGVDQEVGAGNNSLPFLQSRRHRVVVTIFSAELDETRLQLACAFAHKAHVVFAGGHDRAARDGQRLAHVHAQFAIDVHVWPKFHFGVR